MGRGGLGRGGPRITLHRAGTPGVATRERIEGPVAVLFSVNAVALQKYVWGESGAIRECVLVMG